MNYSILRYGSLYGRRSNHFNYIYSIVQQAVTTGRIVRKGDGEEIRSYIHVEDAARCSVDILDDAYENQYVMLTGSQSIKVRDLLNMVREIFNGRIAIEYSPDAEPGHYAITPYAFAPRIARKMTMDHCYDLGQGILDVIYDVYAHTAAERGSP